MKEAGEGFDASGRSNVHHRLEAPGNKFKIPLANLGASGITAMACAKILK